MNPARPTRPTRRTSLVGVSSPQPPSRSNSAIIDTTKQSPAAPANITHPSLSSAKPAVFLSPSVQSGDSHEQSQQNKLPKVASPFTPPRQPQIVRETSVAAHTDHHSLQETLRTLADEGTGSEVYWLPVAVARFGFKNANVRAAGLNIRASVDADNPDDKLDPTKAILSRWSHAAKTEEKLYELQQRELRQQKTSMFAMAEESDAVDAKNAGLDPNDDDEDLQELLDELRVSAPNPNFRRANERRSKRFTSQFEEEIAERNVHLRQRMEQMNLRVKRFEKGFEALDSLAVKMDTLAESSKRRVQFLEQCLVPLYNESSWHQICRNNAEKAAVAIEAALNHYQVPEQLSAVIQAGPVKNLSAYCKALERVKSSLDFFSEYHLATPEFEHVSALYRTGRENLIKEFRDLLRMHSKAVPAVIIQDAIVNNLHDPSISHDFAHFAETVYNDLKMVTAWFVSTKDSFDFMDVYAKFRLDAMKDSLDQFRSFYKESTDSNMLGGGEIDLDRKSMSRSMGFDGSSMHSSEMASQMGDDAISMAPVNGEDGPKSYTLKRRSALKGTPRKKNVSHGTATQGLFQKLRRIKTKNSAMKKTMGARVGIDEDTYQKVETYMAMVSAFLKLLESEVGLMYGIIPDEHMRDVFDRIVLPAILRFESSGKELSDKILFHVNNGDFSAVLLLLQLLEHFEDLKPLFASALEGCTHETQHHWTRVEQAFRSAVLRTMDGFLANIKSSTDRVLPPDGTVHEVTSNTIAFLTNLVDYRVLFDSVITPDVTDNQRKSLMHSFRAGQAQNVPTTGHNFPKYLNSVVSHLLASLTTRSENYNDPTLKAVFLLNNSSYMYNHLKQVGIINIMMEDNQDVDRLISGRISEQRRAYVDCWTVLTRFLTEAIGEAAFLRPRSPNDVSLKHSVAQQTNYDEKLKEKDRQLIKDRCVAINKELTSQAVKQEKYSVPDHHLRAELKMQNRNDVLHLYDTYRQRYTHIPFTKFYDKYLPFTTSQVSDMLDRFFSQDTFTAALNTPGQIVRIDD